MPATDETRSPAKAGVQSQAAPRSRPWTPASAGDHGWGHPGRVAALIGVLAQALFSYRLTTPHTVMFDEVHYVPAARKLLTLAAPANTEHPLVGKEIIAAGIALFGDTPLGWRALSTLAGTATVLGVFWIVWLMFRRTRTAALGATFALLNFTIFVEARIAMLDGFMAMFVVLATAMLLWSMRAHTAASAWPRWVAGSVLLGLAVGAKWTAVPFVAYAGAAFLTIRLSEARRADRSVWWALNAGGHLYWPGLAAIPALMTLGIVSVAVYFATFTPAFYYHDMPLSLDRLLWFQGNMYAQQTQVLPSHPYQSQWWSWPLMIRPIWYLYEYVDGATRGVLMIGNPAVLWGGLVAVAACGYLGWRERSLRLLGAAALWAGAYLPWIIIPKSLGFFYYYYLPSVFLPVAIAAALQRVCKGRFARWDEGAVLVALGLFAFFYPILSAAPLAGPQSFHRWMWFPTWP
ncbi:phospholipid carrier-dependent glycosyltransferase [Sphingomonas sp. H39-1-10]|uniref:phospholipid carrier-dependent glycosyltransferase n=1 Tax=Sphingomonas pollutisoli TaxID=3030829 RepID=UPI0023B9B6A6|nr:phospholipid carrier-dependent glycosyltransferase [Sphingomonas pollutisoli]MDF0489423.1 phospholipid carrier-dependent glycosyltransferase [Sphingomonas pollutisoli]